MSKSVTTFVISQFEIYQLNKHMHVQCNLRGRSTCTV